MNFCVFLSNSISFTKTRGDRRNEHFGWHYFADCALIDGDCSTSLGLYRESLRHAQAIGDRLEMSFEVQGVAMSLSGLGRHDVAVRLASAAKTEWARLGVDLRIRFWDALTGRDIGSARRALGDREAARVSDEGKAIPRRRDGDRVVVVTAGYPRRASPHGKHSPVREGRVPTVSTNRSRITASDVSSSEKGLHKTPGLASIKSPARASWSPSLTSQGSKPGTSVEDSDRQRAL